MTAATPAPLAKLAQQRRSLLNIAKTIHGPRPEPNAPLGTRHTSHTCLPLWFAEPRAGEQRTDGAQRHEGRG